MTRREVFQTAAAAAIARPALVAAESHGRLKQSVSYWTYAKWYKLDELCVEAKRIGLLGIDLVTPDQYAAVIRAGLVPAMTASTKPNDIPTGLNRLENHDAVLESLKRDITLAAEAKVVPNVITFSGNRKGMPDGEGLKNCVVGLNKIKTYAEERNVTVCVELLNSKVDHKDYMADHVAWGAELVKTVASPRVKLLYDIYHMQIMEGDIIRNIRANFAHIGHFHTGGNPGRHEIDGTQELNWNAVAKAIADLNYTGFLAHEFVPVKTPPIQSLEQAFEICKV